MIYTDLQGVCHMPLHNPLSTLSKPKNAKILCRWFRKTLIRTGPKPNYFTIIDSTKTPRVTRPTKAQKKAYRKSATFLKLHPVG